MYTLPSALCPLPSALCPLPSALCPSPPVFPLPRVDFARELFVGQRVVAHPREAHFIDQAFTASDPVSRVWILRIPRRIVVPRDDMKDGARRQQRRAVVRVVVGQLP